MKRIILSFLLCLAGCTVRAPENAAPAPPGFQPLEDVALAKKQAAEQNKPLLVLSVLGDYKKHC